MPSPATTVSSSSTPTPIASTSTALRTITPSDGSRTLVIAQPGNDEEGSHDESSRHLPSGTLRLRGGPRSRPQVAWDIDVVDNENMGKKKSKICCIYHKPKAFDESSDEDSSSGSDSDTDPSASDDGRARPSQRSRRQHHCSHGDHDCTSTPNNAQRSTDLSDISVMQHHHYHHRHLDKPNAYEVQPLTKGRRHAISN
ncbi:hypothetical protein Clacol_002542 [Clathrus columnatus]|uniref:Type 1 phosphatases regulator n=1 Tax=Clathrus columnatus TaxID=1419009 RepID=A0AAV5A700_9AGAM|nr:hypothetical protein Clacol_002542 [Clathrus columnatus]